MSIIRQSFGSSTSTEQKTSIKKLLKEKNLNPKRSQDLKYLLSLSLLPKTNKFNFNFRSLISLLIKYKTEKNEHIFYDFFFQSCELGKIDNVKILLEHGLDINRQNELGETPLHIAIAKNDAELVKIIMQYEPRTDLVTKKDGFSVVNYAEICGNENIIKMVNELNDKYMKNKIKNEVVDLIKKDMMCINVNNMSNISLFSKNNNLDEIQNYEGEKITMLINDEDSINMSSQNKKMSNKSKKDDKNNTNNTLPIINDSELYDDFTPKNMIKINTYNNHKNFINTNAPKNINLNEIKFFPSPSKKKECTSSIKSSYLQSLKTSHTLSKEHELSPINKNNKIRQSKFIEKENELIKFITEINLPKKYSEILLENGFDNLQVLIKQMKGGLALSYQNLKDIGIGIPGDRAKILIHLEEISGNFEFSLEKDIIYSNQLPQEKSGSLYQFLQKINLEEYFQLFIENGYNSAELLFVQMISKNPITEEILKDELGINKIGHLQRILISLKDESEKYVNRLVKKNWKINEESKSIIYEENPYLKSCEACFIF